MNKIANSTNQILEIPGCILDKNFTSDQNKKVAKKGEKRFKKCETK